MSHSAIENVQHAAEEHAMQPTIAFHVEHSGHGSNHGRTFYDPEGATEDTVDLTAVLITDQNSHALELDNSIMPYDSSKISGVQEKRSTSQLNTPAPLPISGSVGKPTYRNFLLAKERTPQAKSQSLGPQKERTKCRNLQSPEGRNASKSPI